MSRKNAPMNQWVYYQNRKDSNIRYYMRCKSAIDAKIMFYIILGEYGCNSLDCTRDEFVYITEDAAQKAMNYFTDWEHREE